MGPKISTEFENKPRKGQNPMKMWVKIWLVYERGRVSVSFCTYFLITFHLLPYLSLYICYFLPVHTSFLNFCTFLLVNKLNWIELKIIKPILPLLHTPLQMLIPTQGPNFHIRGSCVPSDLAYSFYYYNVDLLQLVRHFLNKTSLKWSLIVCEN